MKNRPWLRAAKKAWRETSPALKKVVLYFEPPGFVLLAGGVVIDLTAGWDALPFTSNVISNLSGALIGVPIGLVVLQRLLSNQADLTEKNRLLRVRCKAGRAFPTGGRLGRHRAKKRLETPLRCKCENV